MKNYLSTAFEIIQVFGRSIQKSTTTLRWPIIFGSKSQPQLAKTQIYAKQDGRIYVTLTGGNWKNCRAVQPRSGGNGSRKWIWLESLSFLKDTFPTRSTLHTTNAPEESLPAANIKTTNTEEQGLGRTTPENSPRPTATPSTKRKKNALECQLTDALSMWKEK